MKKMLPVVMLISGMAFGFTPQMDRGVYVGGGEWKTSSGETGTYRHHTRISKAKGGVHVSERLVINHNGKKEVEQMDFLVVGTTKNGFFDVMIKGKKMGSGYCMKRSCHMGVLHKGGHSEETFHFAKDGRIMRLGSDTSKQMKVVWSGSMHKKHPAPKH